MKKLVFLLATMLVLTACDENKPETAEEQASVTFAKATYFEASGTNTVPNVEGENKDQPFSMDNVRAEVVLQTDNTLNINLYGIKFASKMPAIDMVIPGVQYTRTADKITLSGDNIIPTMGNNPVERYVVTNLTGTITADLLTITNNYATYENCTYRGEITKMEERD